MKDRQIVSVGTFPLGSQPDSHLVVVHYVDDESSQHIMSNADIFKEYGEYLDKQEQARFSLFAKKRDNQDTKPLIDTHSDSIGDRLISVFRSACCFGNKNDLR